MKVLTYILPVSHHFHRGVLHITRPEMTEDMERKEKCPNVDFTSGSLADCREQNNWHSRLLPVAAWSALK